MKVFLSHSSIDKALARRLARDLMSANIDVWLDQWEIEIGEAFVQSIEKGVDEAEFVIVLLTRASIASDWVELEWRRKFESEERSQRIAVLPVLGEPCDIPSFLAHRSHVDLSGGSYPLGFKRLLEILRHYSDPADILAPAGEPVAQVTPPNLLPIVTPITLEVGGDLIPIFEKDGTANRFLKTLVPMLRETLKAEFGFPFPGIRVRGNEIDMPPCSALIMIEEIPEIMIEVGRDDVLVEGTAEQLSLIGIRGESRDDPAAGRAWVRIAPHDRIAAGTAGFETWDAAEYLILALRTVIGRMASLFLDIDVTRGLVDALARTAPELVAETVPKTVSWYELTEVLQYLVDERICIGDMERILTAIARRTPGHPDGASLAEAVRHALKAQITAKFTRGLDSLTVLRMDPGIEARISSAIQHTPQGGYLSLAPQLVRDILAAIREQMNFLDATGSNAPVLLTTVEIRRYIRNLVKLDFPSLHVLSQQDIEPGTRIRTLSRIPLDPIVRKKSSENRGAPS